MSFTDLGANQEIEYRSVSRLAVLAFVLGLLCPLALVHPLAWAIPFCAVPVAWQAIRTIAKPDSMLSGTTVAIVGLLMAVLFSVWAPAKHLTQTHFKETHAREFADTWLNLVRDNHLQEAHRWMLPSYRRMPEMTTQQFYETNVELQEDLKSEFTKEPGNLIASQPNSSFRFLGVELMQKVPSTQGTVFVLKYVLERDEGDLEDVVFHVRISQAVEKNVKHWQIMEIFKPV